MGKRLLVSLITVVVLILGLIISVNYVYKMDKQKNLELASAQQFKVNNNDNPYAPPGMDKVPVGEEGELIKLGYKEHMETSTVLDGYVGNKLNCTSCHADGGVGSSLDLVGVSKTYPQYNSRAGKVITLEERVNGCFKRSMNGKPLPIDSKEMKAFIAYYSYISQNVPDGTKERPWAELKKYKGDINTANVENGRKIYTQTCITCHGQDGSGQEGSPGLWGDNSFNIGAGMNRLRTTAGFIKRYMPKVPVAGHDPGSLTDQEALDIAAYIHSMERPDFPDKIHDWPKGDAPDDAAYETLAEKKY